MKTNTKEVREAHRRLTLLKRNSDKNWRLIEILEMRLDDMKYA